MKRRIFYRICEMRCLRCERTCAIQALFFLHGQLCFTSSLGFARPQQMQPVLPPKQDCLAQPQWASSTSTCCLLFRHALIASCCTVDAIMCPFTQSHCIAGAGRRNGNVISSYCSHLGPTVAKTTFGSCMRKLLV